MGNQASGNRWNDRGGSYGNNPAGNGPAWSPPWAATPWGGPPFWHPAGISRPAALLFTVLGFMFWWPVGLAILFYMVGSGRMGCFGRRARAQRYQNWQEAGPFSTWKAWACGPSGGSAASSGNHAFDEYRAETLRRLEEEQKDFTAFLERLRFAKDKAEFDQFMADRRSRPATPPAENQPSA